MRMYAVLISLAALQMACHSGTRSSAGTGSRAVPPSAQASPEATPPGPQATPPENAPTAEECAKDKKKCWTLEECSYEESKDVIANVHRTVGFNSPTQLAAAESIAGLLCKEAKERTTQAGMSENEAELLIAKSVLRAALEVTKDAPWLKDWNEGGWERIAIANLLVVLRDVFSDPELIIQNGKLLPPLDAGDEKILQGAGTLSNGYVCEMQSEIGKPNCVVEFACEKGSNSSIKRVNQPCSMFRAKPPEIQDRTVRQI